MTVTAQDVASVHQGLMAKLLPQLYFDADSSASLNHCEGNAEHHCHNQWNVRGP